MPHPYPKPKLPQWPNTPILPVPTSHEGFFTTAFTQDGCSGLWGFDEFVEESNFVIANQFPGTHEARSLKFFLDHAVSTTQGLWQVQDAPGLNAQQAASVNAGCTVARMIGEGLTGWDTAYHDDMDGTPYVAITGGAFSNNNYSGGVVIFHGVTSDEVLGIFRNAATAFIRAGGISE
jgi:hypothetical protein